MKKFMYGIAAMSLAVAFTGCDDDDNDPGNNNGNNGECFLDSECGGYACDIADEEGDEPGVCLTECIEESDCADGNTCNDAGECVSEGGNGEVTGYTKVLIVSRSDGSIDEDDCRAPNPGPDIDYVFGEKAGQTVYPSTASGAHGDKCGSADVDWADPGVVLENLSIGFNEDGDEVAGWCAVENAKEKFYYMGAGQAYSAGETIADGTGYLLVEFAEAFEDGDIIEVGEVGIEPGADGVSQTCDFGPETPRKGDIFSIYLVSSDVASVGVGTELVGPDFLLVQEEAIGLVKAPVILD